MGDRSAHDAESSVTEEKALTPESAEAILYELASTYSKDIVGSLGALLHFSSNPI
jgi:hypothetical protein